VQCIEFQSAVVDNVCSLTPQLSV